MTHRISASFNDLPKRFHPAASSSKAELRPVREFLLSKNFYFQLEQAEICSLHLLYIRSALETMKIWKNPLLDFN
jgi:hypothetical protein